jgi:hypothetical protein
VVVAVTLTGVVGAEPPGPELVLAGGFPDDCVLDPLVQLLATHTGALAFAGAFADALLEPAELCVEL